jgi:integrase
MAQQLSRKERLTARLIESLKPSNKPYEIRDRAQPGLILRVQPSGFKAFIVRWGQSGRVTLKPAWPSTQLDAARAKARQALVDVDKTGQPSNYKPKAGSGATVEIKTFSNFLTKRYAAMIADRKAHAATMANLETAFDDLLRKPLHAISSWDIEKFKSRRLNQGKAPATVNRDLDRMRAALNAAVKLGLIERNPVVSVTRCKVDNKRVRFLSADEEKRLRKALLDREKERRRQRKSANSRLKQRKLEPRPMWPDDGFTDHLAPLVLLALNSGLRRGELLGLTWENVDLERKQLTVAASTSKSQRTRHLPLNTEALDVLTKWKKQGAGTGLVFRNADGEQFTHTKRSWESLVEAAELKNFRFHDLRHHFASRLAMSGVDLYAVQQLLGHSDSSLTQRYAHLSPGHLADAVAKLERKR